MVPAAPLTSYGTTITKVHQEAAMYFPKENVSSAFFVASYWCFFVIRNLCHPSHYHPLILLQKPSLFLCDACNTTATDLSYVCTECSFSIHKSCASAPPTYKCKFHDKHPLDLVYSLPEEHREFVVYCSICDKYINPIYWLYYCANCRFFAHVKCASSNEMLRKNEDDEANSDLVHFPFVDESSLNEMMQQFIKATNSTHIDDPAVATPPNQINHWAHKQHQLVLTKRNAISPFDLNSKLLHEGLLICDGCTKPICSSDDTFYECSGCNFVLHTPCAQFPKEIQHPVAGKLVAQETKPYEYFQCGGCGHIGNGICFYNEYTTEGFHIGCLSLPTVIKHEAHHHPLYQCKHPEDIYCKACIPETPPVSISFGCERCSFYIHMRCALRPRIVTHRWDTHPLSLMISSQDKTDHPHEFQCEFCSESINPNSWFYHCKDCDQPFHMDCIYLIYRYPDYKFGATNIHSEKYPHPHGLTFLLNKKKRSCNKCGKDMRDKRVLECSPCQFMVHATCR